MLGNLLQVGLMDSETLKVVYTAFSILSMVFLVAACGILFFLLTKLIAIRDPKEKYDFINENEIKYLRWASFALIVSAALIVNTLFPNTEGFWIGVRIFVTVMLSLIVGVTIHSILKFYYPFFIEKRLKKLRYTPRVSSKSGLPMVLLGEEEEDAYLDEGMQAEENAYSVDYDVWICKQSGDVKIEKYMGHLHAEQCNSCNYQTLRIVKEEIVEKPSAEKDGLLMKYYKCSYCGHKVKKQQHLKLSTQVKQTARAEQTA
jgi:hypothetical protein